MLNQQTVEKLIASGEMTEGIWDKLSPQIKDRTKNRSELDPELHSFFYKKKKVRITWNDGSTSYGFINRTRGWEPLYILTKTKNSYNAIEVIGRNSFTNVELFGG